MNKENFLKWFEEQLLKSLTEPSLIVLDNAPYHSMLLHKTPNCSWTKAAIQGWLRDQNIEYDDHMFKSELLTIVKQYVILTNFTFMLIIAFFFQKQTTSKIFGR